MTEFDGKRLTQSVMNLPVDGIRRGEYSDKYFENVARILSGLHSHGNAVGDIIVEAQIFNRRAPYALVGGVDAALALLRHASGGAEPDDAWRNLEVEAIHDGAVTEYDGNPETVHPVIRIRGCYRDFALLETPILGYLTRISRIATNVYETLKAADGKPVLFFPARFDLPEVQAVDGYAYWLAVQRYWHRRAGVNPAVAATHARVSTDAQGRWWGGRGTGTTPHALIALHQGDTAAAMIAFAEHLPLDTPRIVLADFNNDVVGGALDTLNAYWPRYRDAYLNDDSDGMRRWTLNGVRIDTAGNLLDASLVDPADKGVSPVLVRTLRAALDAWAPANMAPGLDTARELVARGIQIVVTGGFNAERIAKFESEHVPVDVYGVGSSLLVNDKSTSTDFTMDVVRAKIGGEWVSVAKVGRRAGDNPALRRVDLTEL